MRIINIIGEIEIPSKISHEDFADIFVDLMAENGFKFIGYTDEAKNEDEDSGMMACSCGTRASELDIVKTVVSYRSHRGDISDVGIEYKVVCPNCKREGDLAPTKNGAIIGWNENLLKERFGK